MCIDVTITPWLQMKEWRQWYQEIMEFKDPRFDGYPLMDSPLPVLSIVTLYLICICFGSLWMRRRDAFELKKVILTYNCFMVLLSLYLFSWMIFYVSRFGFSLVCTHWITYELEEDFPFKYWAETSVFIVLYSKFIEFMDTMFFILRKHFRQLTFLHVYHHALTVIILWLGLRFLPRGPVILFPLLNTFVHTLMYTYYALTTLGYNMSSCKKYLTMIQIAQQTMFLIACLLYQINDCRYVKTLGKFVVVYVFSLLVLFFNFYVKSYIKGASNIEHNNKEMIKRKDE